MKTADAVYRIRRAVVKDFRGIEFADITPNGPVVIITGENGSGKTSLLAGIRTGIAGGKLGMDVIRHGAEQSEIDLTLEGSDDSLIVIGKTIDVKGAKLAVTDGDGESIASPQTYLDSIIGSGMALDPSEFDLASGKQRVSMMLEAIGRTDEVAEMDARFAELTRSRQERGSARRDKEGELKRLPTPRPGDPTEPVDTAALTKKLMHLNEMQAKRDADVRGVTAMGDQVRKTEATIADIEREIRELQAELKTQTDNLAAYTHELAAGAKRLQAFEPIPLAEVTAELAHASEINAAVEAGVRYRRLKSDVTKLQTEWDERTSALRQIETDKSTLLAEAGFPDAGIGEIGICPDDVTVAGCRWGNVADSHRTVMAMQVAMALSGRLRDVMVSQAAWFTATTLGIVRELAAEKGFRLWLEIPGMADHASVVIDNGEAVAGSDLT